MTIDIKINGVPVAIHGVYSPAEPTTLEEPGCAESFEIDGAHTAHGDDILGIIQDYIGTVEDLVLEAIHDRFAGEEAENEECRREDRRSA